ncbi:hypothetical protein LRS10_10855 [Phenylobacterium sp. J426]|uniref:hypothetical protein n=1 Tax=Phenylobacterium sp. J426 TaxID=2898439 RepID=UPI002150C651|nr:hypothetical protein [Phenylobacterium sp. J426]MCR5874623.1 hypothetical protein [Phenylobacterium sp. J426]
MSLLLLLAAGVAAQAQPAPGAPSSAPSPAAVEALSEVLDNLQRQDQQRRTAAGADHPDRLFAELTRQLEASDAAVDAAILAEASGHAPAAALRPIAQLEGRTPLLPRLMADMQTVSPRTVAYAQLVARSLDKAPSDGPRPSRALALAAADAWKAELARLRSDPIVQVEIAALANAYARLGELQAARSVVDFDPRDGPLARLEVLTAALAWDEAADLAARTDAPAVAAAMMRAEEAERAAERDRRSAAEARLAALLPGFDQAPDPADIEALAAVHLAQAREELLEAARTSADPATVQRIEERLARSPQGAGARRGKIH